MTTHPPFIRDRFTWLAYLMLAYFAYLQAVLGPLVLFLRDELHLSYTVSGLHLSAFSVGMVLAGFTIDGLIRRWGRRVIFWGGGAGMGVGALLLVVGHHVALTIAGSLVMGLPGTYLLILIQSTLSDRHGAQRAIALTESNVIAVIGAGLAPLMVGGLQKSGIGWRGALVAGALAWVVMLWGFRRAPIPPQSPDPEPDPAVTTAPSSRLPVIYWFYWVVVFLSVSVEWCTIFWGADFLENSVGLNRVTATTLMSVFFLAMVIGRFTGSRLTHTRTLTLLLPVAVTLALLGFFVFWLAPLAALNVAGLFVAGLGIANLYPFTLSTASGVVKPSQADQASGRLILASGSAILITPQALGTLADQIGIKGAYGVAGVFLVLALVMVQIANRKAAQLAAESRVRTGRVTTSSR
jgi:predicted MFS family arabinose efflux permease